jgi:tRNA A37 N6-isopentenylltransferase MiaA
LLQQLSLCSCRFSMAVSFQVRPHEQRGIPHHLIDILSPLEEFSAGDFYTFARAATQDILNVSTQSGILG